MKMRRTPEVMTSELQREAKRLTDEIKGKLVYNVDKREVGRLLFNLKALFPHGQWESYFEEHFNGLLGVRTSHHWMYDIQKE
jgi:hypothetical protein